MQNISRNIVAIKGTWTIFFANLSFVHVPNEFKDIFKEILIVSRNGLWMTNDSNKANLLINNWAKEMNLISSVYFYIYQDVCFFYLKLDPISMVKR